MITFLPDLNGRYPEDKELFFKELPDEPELYNPLPDTSSSYEEGKVDTVYNLWLSDTTMGYALDDITSLGVKMKNFHDSRKEVQESKCKVKEDKVISIQSKVEMKKAECATIPNIVVTGTAPGATKSFSNPRNKICYNVLKLRIEKMKAISLEAIRCRFAETIEALDYFTKQSVFWGFIATAQLG
jgi:hypothetical protein